MTWDTRATAVYSRTAAGFCIRCLHSADDHRARDMRCPQRKRSRSPRRRLSVGGEKTLGVVGSPSTTEETT